MASVPLSTSLAIDGGSGVRTRPLATWPCFAEDEVEAAAAVLRSGRVNYWTGDEGRQFEREFADSVGRRYAVALANGTVALELALYALGIGPGDEVIVPAKTFIASASCAVIRGAVPVIADIDRDSQALTAESIRRVLSARTKAIIVVHLAGWPADMDAILELARERGLKVIGDCAQAHGATYKGRNVGSFGDVAAFSFCQDKILTTGGEGGMLVTDDPALWERAWSFKDHGKSYAAVHAPQVSSGFRWLHESFGTNWRLTGMQSAIGRIELRKLDGWVKTRRRNAAILTRSLGQIPGLRVTPPPEEIGHAYYKYYAFVRPERLREGWNRDRIMSAINGEGIPCFTGSCSEIYLEKAFSEPMRPPTRLEVARELSDTSLMFLVHPSLSELDMVDTCAAVQKVLSFATEQPPLHRSAA